MAQVFGGFYFVLQLDLIHCAQVAVRFEGSDAGEGVLVHLAQHLNACITFSVHGVGRGLGGKAFLQARDDLGRGRSIVLRGCRLKLSFKLGRHSEVNLGV